jgi:hypothetical protein
MRWNEWVLPTLLVLAWTVAWVMRGRVPFWFAGVALGVVLLTFPIGAALLRTADQPEDCYGQAGCLPGSGLTWWFNGIYGLPTLGALSLLSLAVLVIQDNRSTP